MTIINTYMNNFFKTLKKSSGFTLIELLVVIGILGILAAALIATIDPFEQLKKAQDANVKNTAVEFVNANIRYYSTHNQISANCQNAAMTALGANDACITDLIADGELKDAFTNATEVFTNVSFLGGTGSMTACFIPQSKAQKKDPNTKYNNDGTTGCDPNVANAVCYWCSL